MEVKLTIKAAKLLKSKPNIKNTVLLKRCIQDVRALSFIQEGKIVLPTEVVTEINDYNNIYKSCNEKQRIRYISKDDKEAQVAYDFARYISELYKVSISAFIEYCLIRGCDIYD